MKANLAKQFCYDGAKLLEAGKMDAALSEFTVGLSATKDPYERGTLYYNTAMCHARLQRRKEAIGALAEAVKAYPRHLPTIRSGTDFPELTATAEFESFLANATAYTTSRRFRSIGYGLVWIVALIAWKEIDGSLHQSNPNLPGIVSILIACACAGVIDIFRRLKRRWDAQAYDSFTRSIVHILNTKGDPVPPFSKSPALKCPQCGHDYNLTDYRQDAQRIFCADCNAELPRR